MAARFCDQRVQGFCSRWLLVAPGLASGTFSLSRLARCWHFELREESVNITQKQSRLWARPHRPDFDHKALRSVEEDTSTACVLLPLLALRTLQSQELVPAVKPLSFGYAMISLLRKFLQSGTSSRSETRPLPLLPKEAGLTLRPKVILCLWSTTLSL
jgi:hypothetical protein